MHSIWMSSKKWTPLVGSCFATSIHPSIFEELNRLKQQKHPHCGINKILLLLLKKARCNLENRQTEAQNSFGQLLSKYIWRKECCPVNESVAAAKLLRQSLADRPTLSRNNLSRNRITYKVNAEMQLDLYRTHHRVECQPSGLSCNNSRHQIAWKVLMLGIRVENDWTSSSDIAWLWPADAGWWRTTEISPDAQRVVSMVYSWCWTSKKWQRHLAEAFQHRWERSRNKSLFGIRSET